MWFRLTFRGSVAEKHVGVEVVSKDPTTMVHTDQGFVVIDGNYLPFFIGL